MKHFGALPLLVGLGSALEAIKTHATSASGVRLMAAVAPLVENANNETEILPIAIYNDTRDPSELLMMTKPPPLNETNESSVESGEVLNMTAYMTPVNFYVPDNHTNGDNETLVWAYSMVASPPVLYMNTGNESEGEGYLMAYTTSFSGSGNETESENIVMYSMVSVNPPFVMPNETMGENQTFVLAYSTASNNPPVLYMRESEGNATEGENATIVYSMVSPNPPFLYPNETQGENETLVWAYSTVNPQVYYPMVGGPSGGWTGNENVTMMLNSNETFAYSTFIPPVMYPMNSEGNEVGVENGTIMYMMVSANPPYVSANETSNNETLQVVVAYPPGEKPIEGNETEGVGEESKPNRTSLSGPQPNSQGEKPSEPAKGKPAWLDLIMQMFPSPNLKVCGKRKNVTPENGSPCSKKKSKTCYFGNQACPNITAFPETMCLCGGPRSNRTWTCTPVACP